MQAAPTQPAFGSPPAAPAPKAEALDPTIVNLAKAIRQTETRGQADPYTAKGASGEFGAYQYTEPTWQADVKAFTGKDIPLAQADKILQNEVAYKKLESLKKQGYNVGQIASIWNSGSPEWEGKVGVNKKGVKYNVPQYVDSVANAYQAFKSGQEPPESDTSSTVGKAQIVTPQQQADQASAQQSGAFFPAVTGDSPLSAGLKTAGNLIPSAINFAKGALETINPINIFKNLSQIPGAFSGLVSDAGGVGNATKALASELPGTAYKALVPEAARDLIAGDIEGAQRSVTNDPFGQIAPFVFGAKGLAKGVDAATSATSKARTASYVENLAENTKKGEPIPKDISTNLGGAVDTAIEKTAGVVTKPIAYAFGKAADIGAATTKYGVSKVTGFEPKTIDLIKENPEAFTPEAISSMSRKSLGEEVASKLKARTEIISETGNAYKPVRQSTKPIKVDKNFLGNTLSEETGLMLKKGKFEATAKSPVDSPTDIAKVQRLYDMWQPYFKRGQISADDFLTLRSKLATIANYEGIGKSKPLELASSRVRGGLNTKYRTQIKGLDKLDENFAAQATELNTLRKGFIDKDGNLTDAAINRIANATGKGKDALLARLEEISPGITHRIKILKAIEDVQNIHKVGTYTKSALEGGGLVGGIATGNIPLIVGSIATLLLSQPEVAVRMIRGYGKFSGTIAGKVLERIKGAASTVNNLPQSRPVQASVFGRNVQQLPAPTQ